MNIEVNNSAFGRRDTTKFIFFEMDKGFDVVFRGELEPVFRSEKSKQFEFMTGLVGDIETKMVFFGTETRNLANLGIFEVKKWCFIPFAEGFEKGELVEEVKIEIGEVRDCKVGSRI